MSIIIKRITAMNIFTIATLKTTSMFRDSSERHMRLLKQPLILSVERVETGQEECNQFITITIDKEITTAMTWVTLPNPTQCPMAVRTSFKISLMEVWKAPAVQFGGAERHLSNYFSEYFAYRKASTYIL